MDKIDDMFVEHTTQAVQMGLNRAADYIEEIGKCHRGDFVNAAKFAERLANDLRDMARGLK